MIPATKVEIHTDGDPTALGSSSPPPRVTARWPSPTRCGSRAAWDDGAGTGDCEVEKLGAHRPGQGHDRADERNGQRVVWIEDVKVRYRAVLAPIAKVAGAAGFRLGMRKLGKQLATR